MMGVAAVIASHSFTAKVVSVERTYTFYLYKIHLKHRKGLIGHLE